MKDLSWLDHPAIANIDPKKLDILKELMNEADGMPLDKTVPLLLKANATLKAQNLSFSTNESALIMEILTKDMSSADKVKFENMKRMMGKMGNRK